MQGNLKLQCRFTSTGIVVEALDESGQVLATREIGKAKMQHWVSAHAGRQAAIEFDHCVTSALYRDENPDSTLASVCNQLAFIQRLANGVEEIAV